MTQEKIWFNHATFFHVSTLEPAVRDALLTIYKPHELPNNTYYGDGTPIEPEVLDTLRAAYDAETVKFPWQRGDILFLDNLLVAHAREKFAGPRKILVGMADVIHSEQLLHV
ncbi:Taurine catabolism dioxygenase TauD, TfdA family [compost metagenome]